MSYHYYSYPSLTTVGAADEKIDWRRLKSHLILLSLIKGRVSGLKHYQRLASQERPGMRNRAALGRSHPIHSSRQTPRINSSPAFSWRQENRSAALLPFIRVAHYGCFVRTEELSLLAAALFILPSFICKPLPICIRGKSTLCIP